MIPALRWKKSTYTDAGNCVELALPPKAFALRDSKNPTPTLYFPRPHFGGFLAALTDPGQLGRT